MTTKPTQTPAEHRAKLTARRRAETRDKAYAVSVMTHEGLDAHQIGEELGLSASRVRKLRRLARDPGLGTDNEAHDVTLGRALVTAWTVWQEPTDGAQEAACRVLRKVVNEDMRFGAERLWKIMVKQLQMNDDPRGFCTRDTPGAWESFKELLTFFDDWLGAE